MKLTGKMAGIYRVCEWIMRFAGANVLWLLFNAPFVLLVLNLINAKLLEQVTFSYIAIVILLPIVFFPSTTALFGVIRKWVMKEEDIKIFPFYWKYYKENYLRSLFAGTMLVLFWIVGAFYGYTLYLHAGSSLLGVYILLIVILYVSTLNFFSITVHFEVKLFASLKNAFLITIGKPLITLGITVVSGLLFYLSLKIVTFFIPFFLGSSVAFTAFLGFYSHLMKVESRRESLSLEAKRMI